MSKSTKDSNWDKILPKTVIVGSLAKHSKDHAKSRQELNNFLTEMKDQRKTYYSECSKETKFMVRKQSDAAPQIVDKKLQPPFHRETEIVCHICRKGMDPFKATCCPCRVCKHVFHRKCVEDKSDLHKIDVVTIDRANTNIGWSCYQCSDLSLLLTDEEMTKLIEDFEKYDIKTDCSLNKQEFVTYKGKLSHKKLTDNEVEKLGIEFHRMDIDKDGRLSWWEFVNYESKRILSKRSKNELVHLLTEKELIEAKALFDRLDENGDGCVTENEAKRAYRAWYMRFETNNGQNEIKHHNKPSLDLHVDQATALIMESDKTKTGNVCWEDFLLGQALYIICGRPNISTPTT